jgi:hypothetical protein
LLGYVVGPKLEGNKAVELHMLSLNKDNDSQPWLVILGGLL